MTFTRMHAGVSYREFIVDAMRKKTARGYLEVGVRDGGTMALTECPSIGVDPHYVLNCNVMGGKKKLFLFQMTSDAFFRDHDPRTILGSPVDAVFLDGLHQFEYLLRDFANSERVCHRDSLIMLDDCLPNNVEMTERVHNPGARVAQDIANWWTGDVWKIVPILKAYRPDLKIVCVDTQPTGTVCVTNLDPASRVLHDRYHDIVAEYASVTLDDEGLQQFYDTVGVQSAASVMSGFDASLYIGP